MPKVLGDIKILFSGRWLPYNVSVQEKKSSRKIDETLEICCQKSWNAMFSKAKRTGKRLWDSYIYRFESVNSDKDHLNLIVSTIPFSIRLGMNANTNKIKELGDEYASKGIFSSCIIQTSDNQYVFIEKSNKYFTQKRRAFVGGVLSKSEKVLKNGQDLFDEVKKEIKEEIGITIYNNKTIWLRTGYLTENFNVCLLFEALVPQSFMEIKKTFAKYSEGEAKNIVGISRDTLPSAISLFESKDIVKLKILKLL